MRGAGVAKLVDALALGACGETLGGSIPLPGTNSPARHHYAQASAGRSREHTRRSDGYARAANGRAASALIGAIGQNSIRLYE